MEVNINRRKVVKWFVFSRIILFIIPVLWFDNEVLLQYAQTFS